MLLLPEKRTIPVACSALLHMNGANAGTVFIDEKGHTATAGGNAQTSTGQSRFGGSSLLCDGTGDYVDLSASTDFVFGTGDFTLEFWAYLADIGQQRAFVSNRVGAVTTDAWIFYRTAIDKLSIINADGSVVVSTSSSGLLTANVWTHFVCERASGNIGIFINGTSQALSSAAFSGNLSANNAVRIGGDAASAGDANGNIDEFMIIKGSAKYPGNFTPPICPYEAR